jgi:hypothetical protein
VRQIERADPREEGDDMVRTVKPSVNGLEGQDVMEPRMVAIERSRRAAERLWREIGQVLATQLPSAIRARTP